MTHPHLILIVLEDAGRLLGCDGDPVAERLDVTPNIDALAARGTRFDNLFAVCPVCAPARSSMITGQYATKIGTHQMRSTLLAPPRTFTQRLRDAGYFVSWPSKTDFNFDPATCPDGPWRDDDQPWLDRLRAGELNDRPTFLFENYTDTHESGMWPITEPGNHGDAPRGENPLDVGPGDVEVPPYLPDAPEVREAIARHYRSLRWVDEKVGGVLSALRASGREGETVVMVTADHGRGLVREKRSCYPAGLRVPLVIAGPGIEAGAVRHDPASTVDLPATLLAFAGAGAMEGGDGVDLLNESRDLAYFGRDRMDEAFDCVRGCTDGRWFFVHNDFPELSPGQRNWFMERMPTTQVVRRRFADGQLPPPADLFLRLRAPEELFDLDADPHATRDLSGDPAHAGKLAELSAAVAAWRDNTGDLGRVRESELAARGLIADRLGEFAARMEPLPPDLQPPGRPALLERPTA